MDRAESSSDALHVKKQLWIVMSKAVKPPEEVRKHLQAQLWHQIRLERDGIMTLGFSDRIFRFD
jgi:hypothetical protein